MVARPVKKRPDIGQEGAHSVNDGPSDPDTLEPVPCLIGFMLVIGNFGSNHSNGRHQPASTVLIPAILL